MRMLRIDGTGCIEIAIGFLCSPYDVKHGVDVGLQFLVRIGLKHVAGALDGLIDIGIVKRKAHELRDIPLGCLQPLVARMLQGIGRHVEVLITMLTLALREGQGDGHLPCSTDTFAPESPWSHFDSSKGYLTDGIAIATRHFLLCLDAQAEHDTQQNQ